jgi:predicted Zn-dependent protease
MTIRTHDRDEWIDMRADALFEEYKDDAEKIAEADAWCEGAQDADWYAEVERTLADMHEKEPDDLLGSDVLAKVYGLARQAWRARDARLKDMAEDDALEEWKQAGYDNAESRAWDCAA